MPVENTSSEQQLVPREAFHAALSTMLAGLAGVSSSDVVQFIGSPGDEFPGPQVRVVVMNDDGRTTRTIMVRPAD